MKLAIRKKGDMALSQSDGPDGVLFEGDWLPLKGVAVAQAKGLLRDSGISYFSDAIVNGGLVLVSYILRPGDRLGFSQRFGFKAGDDFAGDQAVAESLKHAYPEFLEIAARVKARNMTRDESLRLMASMVTRWMEEQFGPLGPSVIAVLADILKRLQAIEAALDQRIAGKRSDPKDLTDTEEFILEALGTKTMKAASIAKVAKLKHNSHMKTTLSNLVKRGVLEKGPNGYFLGTQRSQDQDRTS